MNGQVEQRAPEAAGLDDLMTPEQTATWLGVNRCTIFAWIASGELKPLRLGRRVVRFTKRGVLRQMGQSG